MKDWKKFSFNTSVYFPKKISSFLSLTKKKIEFIKKKKYLVNLKSRVCSHTSNKDKIHEMFIFHKKGAYVRPHKHINKVRNTNETQEAWIVLRGKIEGEFFDLDDKSIFKCELSFGDCIVVYRGGQRLKVLEDNTIFYEFKNGPYFGAHEDKIDIIT